MEKELTTTMIIELRNVVKRYKDVTALDNVSFSVAQGEYCALLGPNGAGKTTIIKILLDFVRPDKGETRMDGVSCASPSARKRIGYLAENLRLPSHLTARNYLMRAAQLCGIESGECSRRIDEVLDIVGMRSRENSKAATYSKGMAQRIGLAAALIGRPSILILDEPTSGLDPLGIRDLRAIIESLRESRITLLLNSHVLSEVERVCDTAAIMDRGKIIVKDTITNLVNKDETLEDVFVRVVRGRRAAE